MPVPAAGLRLLSGLHGRLLLHLPAKLEVGKRGSYGAEQKHKEDDDDRDADVDGGLGRDDPEDVDVAAVEVDAGREVGLE
jgi:hypothetical protein